MPDQPRKPPLPPLRDGSDVAREGVAKTVEGNGPPGSKAAGSTGQKIPTKVTRSYPGRLDMELISGRLQGHGQAPYQFRADQDPSYYVKILTISGMRVLWGKDLERAIHDRETKLKLGSLIGARRIGREAVTLIDRKRDAQGNVLSQTEHHAHRARWEIEKLQHFTERARRARLARDVQLDRSSAVKERPELRSTFLSLRAAEQLAARKIADPKDRERFLQMLREAISASVGRGEPLPDINLRKKTPSRDSPPSVTKSKRERDEPTR